MVFDDTLSLCETLFDRIDWVALGEVYCDSGGEAFWAAHREPARVLGGQWARALRKRLRPGGRSIYVGAGVAELVPMLCETQAMDRQVVAANLRAAECEVLNRALDELGIPDDKLRIDARDVSELLQGERFDHASVVSVLSDPERWPTVAAVTYGRMPAVLLDVDAFRRERDEIVDLVDVICSGLGGDALITTSVEEVSWFLAWADHVGATIEADDDTLETAIVGDPLGFLELSRTDDGELHGG